jgi:hypothetical protein
MITLGLKCVNPLPALSVKKEFRKARSEGRKDFRFQISMMAGIARCALLPIPEQIADGSSIVFYLL